MLKVGLTGGIGSGKTIVAKIFSGLGIPVFYADIEARRLMESSPELIQAVKNSFGDEAYSGSVLNRKYLAKIVFNDEVKLKKLNQLTHPAVHSHFETWLLLQHDMPYVVEEAALLFESGGWKYFDFILLVTAPESLRIARVMKRDGVSESEVKNRIQSQMPEDEKIPRANFLIFNDDQSFVLSQVLAFHEKLISLNNK
jgi:dephospho-CoA kinase